MNRLSRFATTAVASAALAAAGLGMGANAATSQGGYTWCPGQPLPMHGLGWDMNVCHTFVTVPMGKGNVPMFDVSGNAMQSYLWMDSPPPPMGPPPPPAPRPAHCPPWNVIIGPSECGGL